MHIFVHDKKVCRICSFFNIILNMMSFETEYSFRTKFEKFLTAVKIFFPQQDMLTCVDVNSFSCPLVSSTKEKIFNDFKISIECNTFA